MTWLKTIRAASPDVKARAAREVFTIAFVSLLPLLLGILVQNISYFRHNPFTLGAMWAIFASFLLSGQLFFYATSFAGSIIYVASDDYFQGNFPPRLWFYLVAFTCSAISFAFIGLDPKLDTLNNPVVFVVSMLTFILSVATFYILLVMTRAEPPTAEASNRNDVRELTERVRSLRGEGDEELSKNHTEEHLEEQGKRGEEQ